MNRFTFKKLGRVMLLAAVAAACCLGCGDDDDEDGSGGGNNTGGNSTGGNNGKAVDPGTVVKGTFTDSRDGKTYNAVKIGNLTWMAKNLDYATSSGSWVYDNYSTSAYGRLYTWDAAKTACPSGWRLPTRREWGDLAIAAGGTGDYGNGGAAGTKLKSGTGNWESVKGKWGGGTDDYGFKAEPGGKRLGTHFMYAETFGEWWTSTEVRSSHAYTRAMYSAEDNVDESDSPKSDGLSIRCVTTNNISGGNNNNNTTVVTTGTFTDSRDSKTYKTVKIGAQTWMAENINYQTASDSWCYGDSAASCAKYGRLYTWNAAVNVCPTGWKLPTRDEWGTLAKAAGGTGDYGDRGTAGKALKSTSGWRNGTDTYGFSALPGGERRRQQPNDFGGAGLEGYWWTATEFYSDDEAFYRGIYDSKDNVSDMSIGKNSGFSVRCIKD
jgi:uncharacterized protein (TIGR02145 family)